jgi:AmiR/NasT family two-component response regulator
VRVVIAEDDSIVELGLQRMLKSLGHQVVASARTGEEAVQMVKKSRPHMAILDIEMPERDGLDAAHEITESCPIAILMLTAFSDHTLVKKAAESGAFAYLVKPVTMKQLDAAMGLALARFEDYQKMKKETDGLRHRLEERKIVDRAREILAQYLGISEGEALRRMQAESRRNRRKIEETAKAIIATCEILSRSPTTKA